MKLKTKGRKRGRNKGKITETKIMFQN